MKLFGKKKKRLGIAFGGGGAKGFAHIGAVKAFEEYGIDFDFVAGTSAGSLVGAFYAAGYSYKDMLKICERLDAKDIRTNRVFFMPSKTDGIQNIVREELGDIDIKDLKKPFAVVAVDLISTNEVCITKGSLARAIAGSCAVPGFFQPLEFNGMLLADGGLRNTLPADATRQLGAKVVVGIDVNKYRGGGTKSSKVLDVVSCSLGILMKSNVVKGYINSDIVLRPETKRFKATKLKGIDDMVEEGYRAAIDQIKDILALKNGRLKKNKKRKDYSEEIIYVK